MADNMGSRDPDGNDRMDTDTCSQGKVITGLNVRYRQDGNAITITQIRYHCSAVTIARSS